jgi:hypothetical protein
VVNLSLENEQGTHDLAHRRADGDVAKQQDAMLKSVYAGNEKAARFAYLLNKLNVPDTDGRTVLDNSIIFWSTCMGQMSNHDFRDVPVILAGGREFFNAGHLYDFGQKNDTFPTPGPDVSARPVSEHGQAYNQALVGLLRAFDVRPEFWRGVSQYQMGFGKYDQTLHARYKKLFPTTGSFDLGLPGVFKY